MSWFLVQIIGIICGGVGMVLTWIMTFMPQWRISILAENNGINGRIDGYWISRWDGLWTTCVNQARLSMHCTNYESQVSLTMDLKAGRILLGFAIMMTFLAFIFSVVGVLMGRCSKDGKETRHCMRLTAGILYILSTFLIAIPVIWTSANILTKAYDSSVCRGALRIEMGEALFLAWPTIAFILISASSSPSASASGLLGLSSYMGCINVTYAPTIPDSAGQFHIPGPVLQLQSVGEQTLYSPFCISYSHERCSGSNLPNKICANNLQDASENQPQQVVFRFYDEAQKDFGVAAV
ncbi:claudin-8-like [Leptodactylus fuscus]|uniref:claudin-8-like n=1 Tax=Leptodactylus fuscus TaxID=238119 RepID=UPI003F4EBE3F